MATIESVQPTTDSISQFFAEQYPPVEISTADGRLSLVIPENPLDVLNLEKYTNWEIVSVQGIDELADLQLSVSTTRGIAGVNIIDEQVLAKTIAVTIRVTPEDCPVGDSCDIYSIQKMVNDLATCRGCTEITLSDLCCCDEETLCYPQVHDQRYCQLLIRCCGILRAIDVQRVGTVSVTKQGNSYLFTITWFAPSPYLYFPQMQSAIIQPDEDTDDLGVPEIMACTLDSSRCNCFETCITIPYNGNVESLPKFTVFGRVTNLKITFSYGTQCIENLPDQSVDFNGCGDCFTTLGGGCDRMCGVSVLNFWQTQQSFTNADGTSVYECLNFDCNNGFSLKPNCDEEITVCISGQQIDYDDFYVRMDYWVNYDGFFKADTEIELIRPCDPFDCEVIEAPVIPDRYDPVDEDDGCC